MMEIVKIKCKDCLKTKKRNSEMVCHIDVYMLYTEYASVYMGTLMAVLAGVLCVILCCILNGCAHES